MKRKHITAVSNREQMTETKKDTHDTCYDTCRVKEYGATSEPAILYGLNHHIREVKDPNLRGCLDGSVVRRAKFNRNAFDGMGSIKLKKARASTSATEKRWFRSLDLQPKKYRWQKSPSP